MSQRPSILMVCRDRGPATHLVEIARGIRDSGQYNLVIYAQEPAGQAFADAGLTYNKVYAGYAHHDNAQEYQQLQVAAQNILQSRYDLLIAAVSTTHDSIGIDEAILSQYRGRTLVMQDAPGFYSAVKGAHHHYLCISDDAAQSARQQGHDASVIGMPKLQPLAHKDYPALARNFQVQHGIAAFPMPIVTFCGQYLTQYPGYVRLVEKFAYAALSAGAHVIYRPHPREWEREQAWEDAVQHDHTSTIDLDTIPRDITTTSRIFNAILGKGWKLQPKDAPLDETLAGSHVIAGYCAATLADVVHMNHFSLVPLAVPVAMMWDNDLNAELGGIKPYDQMQDGRGFIVTDESKLTRTLEEAANDAQRTGKWIAARNMALIDNPVDRVLNVVQSVLPRRPRAFPVLVTS